MCYAITVARQREDNERTPWGSLQHELSAHQLAAPAVAAAAAAAAALLRRWFSW